MSGSREEDGADFEEVRQRAIQQAMRQAQAQAMAQARGGVVMQAPPPQPMYSHLHHPHHAHNGGGAGGGGVPGNGNGGDNLMGNLAQHLQQQMMAAQLEALRQREILRQQQLMQAAVARERREAEAADEREAMAAGGTRHGAIADAAVVDAAGADEAVSCKSPDKTRKKIRKKTLGRTQQLLPSLTPSLPPSRVCVQLYENYKPAKLKEGIVHPDQVRPRIFPPFLSFPPAASSPIALSHHVSRHKIFPRSLSLFFSLHFLPCFVRWVPRLWRRARCRT
jgi:hypothetical protein